MPTVPISLWSILMAKHPTLSGAIVTPFALGRGIPRIGIAFMSIAIKHGMWKRRRRANDREWP